MAFAFNLESDDIDSEDESLDMQGGIPQEELPEQDTLTLPVLHYFVGEAFPTDAATTSFVSIKFSMPLHMRWKQ